MKGTGQFTQPHFGRSAVRVTPDQVTLAVVVLAPEFEAQAA